MKESPTITFRSLIPSCPFFFFTARPPNQPPRPTTIAVSGAQHLSISFTAHNRRAEDGRDRSAIPAMVPFFSPPQNLYLPPRPILSSPSSSPRSLQILRIQHTPSTLFYEQQVLVQILHFLREKIPLAGDGSSHSNPTTIIPLRTCKSLPPRLPNFELVLDYSCRKSSAGKYHICSLASDYRTSTATGNNDSSLLSTLKHRTRSLAG